MAEKEVLGEAKYWYHMWSPTHHKDLEPKFGVGFWMKDEHFNEIFGKTSLVPTFFWRAKILTRESEHGNWEETQLQGNLDASTMFA